MGLKINLNNINVPTGHQYKVFYKLNSRTPGNVTLQGDINWGELYGTYTGGTHNNIEIDFDLIDPNPFGKQNWFKILDMVTQSYIIENIYIHDYEFYSNCINCCTYEGGTAIYIPYTSTPTPTSTPTVTPTSTPISDTPTPTPTITPTPTNTPTSTPTSTPTVTPTSTPSPPSNTITRVGSCGPSQISTSYTITGQVGDVVIVRADFGGAIVGSSNGSSASVSFGSGGSSTPCYYSGTNYFSLTTTETYTMSGPTLTIQTSAVTYEADETMTNLTVTIVSVNGITSGEYVNGCRGDSTGGPC